MLFTLATLDNRQMSKRMFTSVEDFLREMEVWLLETMVAAAEDEWQHAITAEVSKRTKFWHQVILHPPIAIRSATGITSNWELVLDSCSDYNCHTLVCVAKKFNRLSQPILRINMEESLVSKLFLTTLTNIFVLRLCLWEVWWKQGIMWQHLLCSNLQEKKEHTLFKDATHNPGEECH